MDSIELRQIEYFLRVAEELNFGRAAKSLRMAQPPLSQQIRRLEERLGVALFERTSRRVALTSAGELLVPAARRTIEAAGSFVALAHSVRTGHAGELRIGFVSAALDSGLPAIIREFRQAVPEAEVTASQMSVYDQAAGLRKHSLDVGLVFSELVSNVADPVELLRRELVVVLPVGHKAARDHVVDLRTLSDETFIGYSQPGSLDLSAFVTHACLAAGFTPRISYHGPQLSTGVAMSAAGLGVTLVPAGDSSLHIEGIVWRKLAPPVPTVGISLIYDAVSASPLVSTFVDFARNRGLRA